MALLGIARTILRKGVTFRTNVELVAFAGEEQGGTANDVNQYSYQLTNRLPGCKVYLDLKLTPVCDTGFPDQVFNLTLVF